MQRLRRGTSRCASATAIKVRTRTASDAPTTDDVLPALGVIPLDQFCVNPPAQTPGAAAPARPSTTRSRRIDLLGPKQLGHRHVRRRPPPGGHAALRSSDAPRRRTRRCSSSPPSPSGAMLVFDVHPPRRRAFPGSAIPSWYLYDTGYDGIANVNDPDARHRPRRPAGVRRVPRPRHAQRVRRRGARVRRHPRPTCATPTNGTRRGSEATACACSTPSTAGRCAWRSRRRRRRATDRAVVR